MIEPMMSKASKSKAGNGAGPRDFWRGQLKTKPVKDRQTGEWKDVVMATLPNVITILRMHSEWAGVIAWDAFGERIVTTKPPPWPAILAPTAEHTGVFGDVDLVRIADWLGRFEGLNVSTRLVAEAVSAVAETNAIHPVRDYLGGLKWDGTVRLDTWLSTYCGAVQSDYTEAVGIRWMISAVARVMRPGCQVDCMLILESPEQGSGKSSAFRALVPSTALYSETGITLGDKDSYQALHGVWIYLLDELDSIRRGEVTKTKNFISSMKDHYRPSYGRVARDFPRQNVFAGTTNETEYLVDTTGNRRFWCVRVVREIDVIGICAIRDQLWAEALARYESGERWHVDTPELRALCAAEAAERVHADPWEQLVEQWLGNPMCDHHEDNDYGRPISHRVPWPIPAAGITTAEVLVHALGVDPDRITTPQSMRVATVLKGLGYERGSKVTVDGVRARRWARPTSSGGHEVGR